MGEFTKLQTVVIALVLAQGACVSEEDRELYEDIEELGMQIVTVAERDSDLAVRTGAVLSAAGLSDVATAEADTLADHELWSSCVTRAAATAPYDGVDFLLGYCSAPYGVKAIEGTWSLGFQLLPGEPDIHYSLGTVDYVTVDGQSTSCSGGGTIQAAGDERVLTWDGYSDAAESNVAVSTDLTIRTDAESGCRTVNGTAQANPDFSVEVTFQSYHVCRKGNDFSQCPTGSMLFTHPGRNSLEVELDGSNVAKVTKDQYVSEIELACTP